MIRTVQHGWKSASYLNSKASLPHSLSRYRSTLSAIKSGLRQTEAIGKPQWRRKDQNEQDRVKEFSRDDVDRSTRSGRRRTGFGTSRHIVGFNHCQGRITHVHIAATESKDETRQDFRSKLGRAQDNGRPGQNVERTRDFGRRDEPDTRQKRHSVTDKSSSYSNGRQDFNARDRNEPDTRQKRRSFSDKGSSFPSGRQDVDDRKRRSFAREKPTIEQRLDSMRNDRDGRSFASEKPAIESRLNGVRSDRAGRSSTSGKATVEHRPDRLRHDRREKLSKPNDEKRLSPQDQQSPKYEDQGLGFRAKASASSRPESMDSLRSKGFRPNEARDERPFKRAENKQKEEDDDKHDMVTVPYTTAASEFLYGTNPVIAALKSQRRRLYKVYLHERILDDRSKTSEIEDLARRAKVHLKPINNSFLNTIDKMTGGRPHNGVVLEASPLPVPPVAALGRLNEVSNTVALELEPQSAEDAAINASASSLPIPSRSANGWRYPLVVLLDGILDPGNLGNILRTCHFYGVDAVAICTNTCAPVSSPVVIKASSGASEAIRIFAIHKPANFVRASKKNKWTVFGAVAPDANDSQGGSGGEGVGNVLTTSTLKSPLMTGPGILMMGSEGEGLRENLRKRTNFDVYIQGAKKSGKMDVGVDSLNVGAATAVLLEAFMRNPEGDSGEAPQKPGSVAERIV